jgi:hypothetical protein
MIKIGLLGVFLLHILIQHSVALPPVLISSSSKLNSFHLTLSLQSHSLYHIYSEKIADN